MVIVRNLWQYVARHHDPCTHPHVWSHDPCARPHDPWGDHVARQHDPCALAHVAWPHDPWAHHPDPCTHVAWRHDPCARTRDPWGAHVARESTPTLTDPTTPGLATTTPAPTPILPDETTPGSAMFPATTTPLREMLVEVQHTSGPGPDSCMPYIVDICGPLTPAMSDATDTSLHVSIPTELLPPTPTVLTPMPVVPQESGSPSNCIYDWNQDISSMFPSLPTRNPSNLHQSVFWPVMMSYIKRNCLLN